MRRFAAVILAMWLPLAAFAQEVVIRIELHRGTAGAAVWTTDFSYDYVRINAEYRT